MDKRRVVVQDQRLKSIIMSCLPDDIIESVISFKTPKATWTDLVHSFEGPLDTKKNRIMDRKLEYQTFRAKPSESLSQTYTRYKTLLNELANDGVNLSKHEISVGQPDPKKDFQENYDDEADERTSEKCLRDLDIEFYERAVLANSKCFQPKFTPKLIRSFQQTQSSQPEPKIQNDYKTEYKKMKAKLTLLEASSSTSQTPKTFQSKNKSLVAKTFYLDEEEVSNDEEMTEVKERPSLGIMKHTKLETQESSSKSVLGLVTVSDTKQITPSVHSEVKNTEQESKINELTKLVQMLIDEKASLLLFPQVVCQQHLLSLKTEKEEIGDEKADNEREPVRATKAIPIFTIKLTDTVLEIPTPKDRVKIELIGSSRPQPTETLSEVPQAQPTGSILVTTSHSQPESSRATPRTDKGKDKVTIKTEEPTRKLVHASRKIHHDPDAPILVPYEINGKIYQLTEEQIQAYLDKEEILKKTTEKAKLFAMTKYELIKVVHKEASKAGIDHKTLESAKGGQEFKKIKYAEMKVLNREHSQKVKKVVKLRKKRIDNYMWTTTNRLKPEPINDVKIHPNSKPAVITVCRGTDRRNFKVHNPFKFGDFKVTELDKLGPIIQKKKNKIVAPEQGSSQLLGRKRRRMELEPELRILALECNTSLPKGVPFVNNMVIEEPDYGMFFNDGFGDKAFQRMSDINKVGVETLITYLVMASNLTTRENQRFCLKLRKLIADHLDQEKLKSKKVKLEFVGYKLD
ncbi:hypothetical protein Tco_0004037 [Tanacetum coccineum]